MQPRLKKDSGPVLIVSSGCQLEAAPQSLVEAFRQELTIDNPSYRDAKKYGRWMGKRIKPELYFYELNRTGIFFPRGYINQAIDLCQRHTGRRPRIVDRRRLLPAEKMDFKGRLRPYQAAAAREVLARQFGVLVAPTGSGKTVMALAMIAARQQPALILIHTRELMYQWRDRIKEFLGLEAGLIGDGQFDPRPVSVAIVNTARRRLAELPGRFGHLVVDECHRVPASLFTGVVTAFDCRFMLGLSATAYRREDGLTRLIYLYMGDLVHQLDKEELTAAGAVLKPEFIQRRTEFKYGFRGNYQALIKALTRNEERNRQIVEDICAELRGSGGTVLVVSDRVAHCERLALLLADRGIRPQVLTGRLAAERRSAIVDAIRSGGIKVLISTLQLVGEGFDVAGLSTLFLTTPIKFSGRLHQVIGRILRPAAGKKPRVIDYLDDNVGVLRKSAISRLLAYRETGQKDLEPYETVAGK